jgi:hypothetical protein
MSKEGFDLQVHIRNAKGQIVREQPYRMRVQDGNKTFERPVGSGQWYFENGKPVNEAKAEVVSTQAAEEKLDAAIAKAQVEAKKK